MSVWGKVMFSQACVIPSVHGGGDGWRNNFEDVLDYAQSALKLVLLYSHKTYCI